MNAIINCRTSILGGHVKQCDQCSKIQYAYNSCRNRHCPKCESFKAAKWLESRKAELLPTQYFHVVFTLPHTLNHLIMHNKKLLYDMLFQSAWKTLKKLGADTKRLNGEMGMLAVLHTWGQNLTQHNHLHCVVPGGALKKTGKWASAKKYLFPVKVLSNLFKGIYISKLRTAYDNQQLKLPEKLTSALASSQFDQLLNQVMNKNWVVYTKKPFGNSQRLLNYLGRYTHKIAITNHRILACDEKLVKFTWRDYANDNQVKIMTLKPQEFIRRFLSHVLPAGFMRIRSFGFLANACKAKKIKIIQCSLKHKPKFVEKKDTVSIMLDLTGKDITLCPSCNKGKLRIIKEINPKFNNVIFDTS